MMKTSNFHHWLEAAQEMTPSQMKKLGVYACKWAFLT